MMWVKPWVYGLADFIDHTGAAFYRAWELRFGRSVLTASLEIGAGDGEFAGVGGTVPNIGRED